MISPTGRVSLHILLLTFIVSTVSGAQTVTVTVTPDRGTTTTISSSQVKGCSVCTGLGRSQRCSTSLSLKDNTRVSVEFKCSRPQDVFSVEIVRQIDCTTKSCSGHIIQADAGALPWLGFNRTFTWFIEASSPKASKIDFTRTGVRQISPSERCSDGHTYTLQAFQATGKVAVGTYCRTGFISSAQTLNRCRFSLDIPAGHKLQSGQFDVSVGEEIKSLAKISLTLPKGKSSSEVLTPNYPESFPDDDVMEWSFHVPDKHKAVIQFLNLTQPQCLKKNTAVEYHNKGSSAQVARLTDIQRDQDQGNFTLTLRNCEMDRRRAGSPGLSLNLRVSTSSTSSPVLCKVDLSKTGMLSLHIDKLTRTSDCEMKMNSVKKDKIVVTSKGDLSFQDCLPEDVHVTASTVIGCRNLKDCPKTPVPLLVPILPSCLPAPLSSVTWTLRPGEHGTVQLTSPKGSLKQSLPGQPCNDSILIQLAEEDGTAIGDFCSRGAIQKVQIHTNVSVRWRSNMWGKTLRSYFKHVLNASFEKEIPERYIFNVAPTRNSPVLVATPGWPKGMAPLSTVSWIVTVPSRMEARLMFDNFTQPKCQQHHAVIKVRRVSRDEEDYSRREDEMTKSEITVSESFYLNMSNCVPESREFSVVTKITLQKAKNFLLTIILSVVAALLVIFVIVLAVVCVVVRRKKKKLDHQVSIYNPNGTNFLPGQNGFPSTSEDEYHVYASIEDTLVYTHLLKKGAEIGLDPDFDTYRSFTGHSDSQRPLVSKNTGADGVETGVYQPFQPPSQPSSQPPSQRAPPLPNRPLSHVQPPLVDNEIYQLEDQSEEEHSPNLGPRLEPEGGD